MNNMNVKAVDDALAKLISGSSSEQFNSPVEQVPHPLPKLIELAREKYEANSENTITELRTAASNLRAVADELDAAADQILRDRPIFSDTISQVVQYEMHCAERVKRYLLIKPSGKGKNLSSA